jgi:hypothetical protein
MLARSSWVLALVLGAALPVLAQEARRAPSDADKSEPERARVTTDGAKGTSEPPTFDDLKNSLGDLEQKESKEEKEKKEAIVQKNVDETLKIYSDALGKRNGELQNVNRRLDVNKNLEGKYDKLLDNARTALATTRAKFINRTNGLKKSLEEGKISREAYDKLLEEDTKRFRNREKELLDDISFYQDEFQNAQRSGKELATKKELMTYDPFGGNDRIPDKDKQPPPVGLEQKLKSTLGEVSGYGARSVVDALK